MKRLSQTGDTIVEVLICIAVVSVVLGGAFVTTRQSQIGVRNSQEHAEALKLIESQIEQLRSDTAGVLAPAAPNPFCMYNAAPQPAGRASYCTQDSDGVTGTSAARYVLSITRSGSIPNSFLFTVSASWPEVTGNGTASESMVYRLYQ